MSLEDRPTRVLKLKSSSYFEQPSPSTNPLFLANSSTAPKRIHGFKTDVGMLQSAYKLAGEAQSGCKVVAATDLSKDHDLGWQDNLSFKCERDGSCCGHGIRGAERI
jgi:hypothetical protein